MVNLVTIDAQHQGVFGFPGCLPENNEFCEVLRDLLEIAYTPLLQENLVQAQYWHDPTQGDLHRRVSKFIGMVLRVFCSNSAHGSEYARRLNFSLA